MRSKKLLAILLALCLVVTMLSPAAYAVTPGEDSAVTSQKAEADSPSEPSVTVNSLRDQQAEADDGSMLPYIGYYGGGDWTVTPTDKETGITLTVEKQAVLEELKAVESLYSKDEKIVAFVVMEDAPLAEVHTHISQVGAAEEAAALSAQAAVINAIQDEILGGNELNVRYQFTYLTNAFTIETQFAHLSAIAQMDGVKSVFVMPTFSPCVTDGSVANPNTVSAGSMTGVHTVWEDLGYTGEGMKIAVIDTGLDLDHPSFAALDSQMVLGNPDYMSIDDIALVLEDLNAYKIYKNLTAEKLYYSTKVPYAFNYVDGNLKADHSSDSQGDHGTHVAGIAAANDVAGTNVVGMAPDAQIIVMKVFGANGGAYMDDIVAALEDAMTLGCDVVNASLGSSAGFSESGSEEMDRIYDNLSNQDIIACYSAGNDGTSSYGNMWGTDLNRTQNPDNAAVGSPSTWADVFSIASAENSEVMSNYFELADGTKVFFMESYQAALGYANSFLALTGESAEYVMIPGVGNEADFYDEEGNSIVEGKIAVVSRGEINYGTKVLNAETAGAIACIVYNNNDTDDIFSMYMNISNGDDPTVPASNLPCAMITMADGVLMGEAAEKTMTVTDELAARIVEGGVMSSFSSWGVSPDLRIVPDITGIGGNVYSCYDGGEYGIMSGTSMSSPQVAGVSALVLQYLKETYPETARFDNGTLREMAINLLMSTADPIMGDYAESSVRQQGAGLVDAAEAVTAESYLTVAGGRPKAELGDSEDGVYTFYFEINNISGEDQTYTLSSTLNTEYVAGAYDEYFMLGINIPLSGDVAFSSDEITVPAYSSREVSVTISLSEDDIAYFNNYWPNGGYVEGFVYAENANEEGVDLNLPFLGFYGDWTDAPVLDTAYWYDNSFWSVYNDSYPEGDEYYHVMWTDLGATSWVLGMNPYGVVEDETGNIPYDSAHNALSPNGDGYLDSISDIYISLLRNAKTLSFTYALESGEVLVEYTLENVSKTMYKSAYGQVVPFVHSWYLDSAIDFSSLPNGTKMILEISATLDYGNGGVDNEANYMSIPITIDTEAPQLLEIAEVCEEGVYKLVVTASDNHALASINLMNPAGTMLYDQVLDTAALQEDGSYKAEFDITGLGTEFMIVLGDYAANESAVELVCTQNGDNAPDLDTENYLYAYRQLDDHIYSDHMYGWVQIEKTDIDNDGYTDLYTMTDDYLEYAAINAAEYAGGKVFAVDAVGNFVVMVPGVWNRTTICNIGLNVIDMTFDDSTDTMYLLSHDSDYGYTYLYSIDLTTGATNELKCWYWGTMPKAIADDDNGTLYAIAQYDSGLYAMNVAEGDYTMQAVTDGEGNPIFFLDVYPSYMQSMTYDAGMLYWTYFSYDYYESALIAIDTESWEYTFTSYSSVAYDENNELVDYYPLTEAVALLSLNETEWQIPEAEAIETLLLDPASTIVGVGESFSIGASPLPWNYDLDESQIEWSSSDENVLTVEAGVVTTIGEGMATVTASYAGVTATCDVTVVNVEGDFYAYAYYSGDGNTYNMINVDLATMDYWLLGESPVDFLCGDYNGHDGYFYGYDEGGQLYRLDLSTGDVTALGDPLGTYPLDMAYDYTTGMLYAITFDYSTYANILYAVNMNNGKVKVVAEGAYVTEYYYDDWFEEWTVMQTPLAIMTLACGDGCIFGIDEMANVYMLTVMSGDMGGGATPADLDDDWLDDDFGYGEEEAAAGYLEAVPVLSTDIGVYVQYLQSMTWDHNNGVLIWANPETSCVYWIDVYQSIVAPLGDPTGGYGFEYVGMFTVPETVSALPYISVESVTADDLLIVTGNEMAPSITVEPFNATNQSVVMESADESIAKITADGTILGVSAGTTTISVMVSDYDPDFDFTFSWTAEFTVTVMDGADDLYAYVGTDIYSYTGQMWSQLIPGNSGEYVAPEEFAYFVTGAEYYDGDVYAYGYDPYDWYSNWQFFVLDGDTMEVKSQTDMGDSFPFIYDMTYDYATSTMYALAGYDNEGTSIDLYIVDMNTGSLILLKSMDTVCMSIAASDSGIYLMSKSQEVYDMMTWTSTYTETELYKLDTETLELVYVGNSGMLCAGYSSMTYDYDTQVMYWSPNVISQGAFVSGGDLCIVDLETGAATSLGLIGQMGAQVCALYTKGNFPLEDKSALNNVIVNPGRASLFAGETTELSLLTMPGGIDAVVVWTSSNEEVATVEDGVITGLSQGNATITATVSYNDYELSAECSVVVLAADASFLTYNSTVMGWAEISRADYTVLNQLNEGEELGVKTIAVVGGVLYGYDSNNQLFMLADGTCERTLIGEPLTAEEGYAFDVRDMEYDAANERMLILGVYTAYDAMWDAYSEIYGGSYIYSVDLTTGAITEVHHFTVESEYTYIQTLAVDGDGAVYFYSTFDDSITILDLETGTYRNMVSAQSISVYGDGEYSHSMYYDALTDSLYLLVTSNGRMYKMITVDASTGAIADAGYVGETWYADDGSGWPKLFGNILEGLTEGIHIHSYESSVVEGQGPTCTEPGMMKYTCRCGDSYEEESPATGHTYTYADNGDGTHTYTCAACGDADREAHTGGTATCTEQAACEYCGAKHGELDPDNHTMDTFLYEDNGDGTHTKFYECCGAVADGAEAHSGGTATCVDKAICEYCNGEHGELDPDNHTMDTFLYENNGDGTHTKTHECCGASVAEVHTYEDGVCICGLRLPTVIPSVPSQPDEPDEPVVENPFVDVVEDDYYYDAVLWAVENGITTGATETAFAPEALCTREQIVTFLWRAVGCPEVEAENPFTDVVEGSYSYKAILWAVANGITNGVTETTFVPQGTCTREQIDTFLWRAAGCPEVEAENPFTDVVEGWSYKAILWAVENGITNGVGGGLFAPAEPCTRGDAVTFLHRAYGEE